MNNYSPPTGESLEILYADEAVLVVNKPHGLLSVPGRGEDKQDCLVRRVQAVYPDALVVHRLDRDTSGLMVLARGKAMESALSILFQKRAVHKRYQALVEGMPPTEGEVQLPLIVDWPNRPRQKVDFETGKPSRTLYRLLKYDAKTNTSRMGLEPYTGRSHQLRVHLMSIGHPILGDELYAPPEVLAKADRLLLHACELGFSHPILKQPLSFSSLPPF